MLSTRNAYASYRERQIMTAPPEYLVALIYKEAILHCKKALEYFNTKDISAISNSIIKVESLIIELLSSLDEEKGGEIAKNLKTLYLYMYRLLVDANVKKNEAGVKEVLSLLEELSATWDEAVKKTVVPTHSGDKGGTNSAIRKS